MGKPRLLASTGDPARCDTVSAPARSLSWQQASHHGHSTAHQNLWDTIHAWVPTPTPTMQPRLF